MQFNELKIGDWFEFEQKTDIGCGKYNGLFRKIEPDAYRGQCFVGHPEPTVQIMPLGFP